MNPSFPLSPLSPFGPAAPVSPLSPLTPLRFPAGFHSPSFLTSTSPVVVLMNVSPSFPSCASGVLVPFRISFPSRPAAPASPLSPLAPTAPS